jgi:hypothetical protein
MSQDHDDKAAIRRDAQSIYDTLGAEGKAALKRAFELREDIIGRLYRRAGIGATSRQSIERRAEQADATLAALMEMGASDNPDWQPSDEIVDLGEGRALAEGTLEEVDGGRIPIVDDVTPIPKAVKGEPFRPMVLTRSELERVRRMMTATVDGDFAWLRGLYHLRRYGT